MRARLSIAAGLIVSLSLLGACQREPEAEVYADAAPPPQIETVEVAPLAGGPSEETRGAATQASNDAYMESLAAKGLMAERRINPDTGESMLVVFNRPIKNPVLRGGPHYRYAANHRARHGSMDRGWASNGGNAGVAAASSGVVAAQPSAPAADAAAPVSEAAAAPAGPAGPGVQPIAEPTVNVTDPARAGFEMTPMMWGIVGLIILALLIALFMANRPKPRRHSYSSHQAPPEASGGDHNGEAHA
jgi:hypothetical protein